MKSSFYIVLFVAFLDHIGVGLIFPIFSSIIFDPSSGLLPPDTSADVRGVWLGLLIAMMPLSQFFCSPIWGTISDGKGRKSPLTWSLLVGIFGYLVATCSIWMNSLIGLFLSRLIIGGSSGNIAIAQAAIADISSAENKAKNYSLYSMALGSGFTLGPLLGGWLSLYGYQAPFLAAAVLLSINLGFVLWCFQETSPFRMKKKIHWAMGVMQLKKAFRFHGLKMILFCSFIGIFGWVYFFEFIPVFLIDKFQFSPKDLGLFFGVAGGCYALCTGLLIRPLITRLQPRLLFFSSSLLTGIMIISMAFVPSVVWVWPLIFLVCYCTAPFTPTATTLVSNGVSPEIQGEALGVLSSTNAVAFALSPLLLSSFVGNYPSTPMWFGGSLMCIGGIIGFSVFRSKLFRSSAS